MSYTVSEEMLLHAKTAREKQTERLLNIALPVVGMRSIEKIRELLSVYDERIYLWLAGLYDKNEGGFYFSNSARDTDGYLPDIESTAQAINLLKNSGLFDEETPYTDIFSTETSRAIVNFFTSRQASDGYFYHPQWGKNITFNRKQRDLRWAIQALEKFNVIPNISIPINEGDDESVNFEFLKSIEAFKKFLSEIDLSKRPLDVALILVSMGWHVRRAGRDYVDELKRWLEKWRWLWIWQETENYDSVNALVKICVQYEIMDLIIPYSENIFEASVKRIEKDASQTVLGCDNPWRTLNVLINYISKNCDPETVYSLRTRLWRRAPELIEKTRDRVLTFQNVDGTFRYSKTNNNTSYGAVVGVKGVVEGNINSTSMASTSTVINMCYALGIPKINIFCIEDGKIFLDAIESDKIGN